MQKGYVVREQLLAAGLSRSAIGHRLRHGRLHERYRGVYAVGLPSADPLGGEMAAVLLFRGHAVLSHRSAAKVWGILGTEEDHVTVTVVGRDHRSRPGLTVHRAKTLDRSDIRLRHGLPVSSPARTVIELASEVSGEELEKAIAEARVKRLLSDQELRRAAQRASGRRGAGRVLRLLEEGVAYTRSKAERRMLALLRKAQLPIPRTNVRLCGYQADFFWAEQRLIVETDGYQFHSHRRAFEHDRKRDQVHVAAGYRVIRITWWQLRDEPLAVLARVAQALSVGR